MLETITAVNQAVNSFIWGIPAMVCIIGVGLLLSVRTGFLHCGSEQNVSDSNLVLDAAVAKSLKSFADALEGTPEDEFQDAALEYCKKVLTDHQRILFSGDGYSDEWPVEAEKRGLANNKTTADALPAFVSDKAIALFEETGVLTKAEAQCRYDCKLEKYNKLMNIEATTMVREARRTYRPVITAYATKVAKGLETIRAAGAEAAMQCEQNTLNKLCNGITTINDSIKALDAVHQKAEALDGQEPVRKSIFTSSPRLQFKM